MPKTITIYLSKRCEKDLNDLTTHLSISRSGLFDRALRAYREKVLPETPSGIIMIPTPSQEVGDDIS